MPPFQGNPSQSRGIFADDSEFLVASVLAAIPPQALRPRTAEDAPRLFPKASSSPETSLHRSPSEPHLLSPFRTR
jgi:hypothetical protein